MTSDAITSTIDRAPSPRARPALIVLWAVGVVGLLAYVLYAGLGLAETQKTAFNTLYVLLFFVPGAICVIRGLTLRAERAAWIAIGAGMSAWAGGYAYTFLVLEKMESPPYPSPADALWYCYYVAAFVGLMLVARHRMQGFRSGLWIDALTGALALAALAAALLTDAVLASTGGKFAPVAASLAYPLLDVLVLGLVLGVFALSGWRPGRTWLILGVAFVMQAVSDWAYLYQVATGVYEPGTLLDAIWPALMLIVAFAAWQRPVRVEATGLDRWPVLVVPLLFASLALGLLAYDHFDRIPTIAVLLAVATLAAAFGRAMTTFSSMRTLARSRELTARHELILNSAGEAILGLDADGRATFANRAAERLTGYRVDELLGRSAHELVHHTRPDGTPYPEEDCPVLGVLRSGEPLTEAADLYWRKDGTSFPIEFSCTPLEEDGRIAGVVQVFRDVTERREIDRMKDEFTSVVSHELRTPLTSIRGSLGLLAAGTLGPLPERGQRMIEIAVQNTDRLVRLINDILDIERIDSGRASMDRQPCEVERLVEQAVEVMRPMAEDAGVELEVSTEPAPLHADADRIVQALTNLLSNAIKFSPKGGTVSLASCRRGAEVLFEVRDRGRGIPPDKLETVFERFQQVDASDSREKGGTGLGLPISRSIVEHHGGRIWAESRPGGGTSFCFTLPVGREAAPAPAPTRDGGEDRPTVLVCDDDPAVLEMVGAMLESRGYDTLLAASGEEAVRMAAGRRPDVILLDLLMPGMDGWETADALREQADAEEVPIVILSVLAEADAAREPRGRIADWLEKPPHEQSLMESIERAVRRHPDVSRVLVVEDDEDLASVLRATFERNGIESLHAADGAEAIELSQRASPDLLVLDVGLPGLDGFAVVDWLKRHERLNSVPMVVYTAHDLSESDRRRLELSGETEFIMKGRVGPEEFEERVLQLLDRVSGAEEVSGNGAKTHSGG